jgi:hypothetical protein
VPEADDTQAPRLVHRSGTSDALPVRLAEKEMSGEFQRLDCNGTKATMVVLTIRGRMSFLIDDPTRVRMDGAEVDLNCGPQAKKVGVRIRYVEPAGVGTGVDGVVRSLNFNE